MSISLEDRVTLRLEELRDEIRAKMADNNENATGRTSDSLRVVKYDGGIKLVIGGTEDDTAPLETLEVGVPAGTLVPISALEEWVVAKGLDLNPWAVREKIKNEGTDRHENNVDIYSTAVKNATNNLKNIVSNAIIEAVKANF